MTKPEIDAEGLAHDIKVSIAAYLELRDDAMGTVSDDTERNTSAEQIVDGIFSLVRCLVAKSFNRDPEARATTAEAQARAMREALEWYAVQVRNCRKIGRDGHEARVALDRDGGDRARRALAREGK